ncbi:putative nuclease HARBI1 [Rhagoletis pomonella]|uniref:putative nuclease HARBI1 n=1 Tax=Rhagoletis pomonella TaxID=28610 RepID=UPI0017809796|nr:putative nuclease HARBI1 [Rhagoletis pomonella]
MWPDGQMEEDFLDLAFLNICRLQQKRQESRRVRRWAVHPVNRDRKLNGYFRKVFLKCKSHDSKIFLLTRMNRPVYDLLQTLLNPFLERPKKQISPEERLAITLMYLAHGTSFEIIASMHKMGKTTVRNIVLETCEIIWTTLSPVYLSEPTLAQYKDIADDFSRMWNMPNCVGAIDGKHIAITCPKNSGSLYFNYKKFYSIVLMATCDAKYTFTSASIGSFGGQSDGGVFQQTAFGRALLSNSLPLPPKTPLWRGSTEEFPHFFVADTAFPLKENLMRPYPGVQLTRSKTVFNYRLSRARRVIENSFGILTARWRVLRKVIDCSPENCEKIVLACLVLHNFVMLNDLKRWYCPENFVDTDDPEQVTTNGEWRRDLEDLGGPLTSITSNRRNASAAAFRLREKLTDYFLNQGAVPFQ